MTTNYETMSFDTLSKVLALGKTKNILVFRSLNRTLTCGRRYSRSGKQKNLRFFLLFARLIELCRFAAKVLALGKAKKL